MNMACLVSDYTPRSPESRPDFRGPEGDFSIGDNSSDCGVYMLHFIEQFCADPPQKMTDIDVRPCMIAEYHQQEKRDRWTHQEWRYEEEEENKVERTHSIFWTRREGAKQKERELFDGYGPRDLEPCRPPSGRLLGKRLDRIFMAIMMLQDVKKYLFAGAEQRVTVFKEFSMKLLASRPNIAMSFFPWQQSMNQILNISYLPSGAAKLVKSTNAGTGFPEAVIEKQKELFKSLDEDGDDVVAKDLLMKKITSDVEEGRIKYLMLRQIRESKGDTVSLVDFAYALRYDSHVNKHVPVKKGHMMTEDGIIFKDWKNIWLVLKEDGIYFYHKETNRTPYKIINQRSFKELQVDPKNDLSFFLKTFNDGVIHFRTCEWFISNKTWILRHHSHTRRDRPVDAHHLVFHLSGNLGDTDECLPKS
ncbi:hypothetical protein PROFUN_11467 [Planoprotostelium fungivorum]|uniref:Ubiquitin-like protease family profile domain-containing protein n=1 Tax=Planoprotostelium fungivorum TaxID=1890364 RepID=A0A2P6N4Y3_9EUKA|nr:hypothetical protein PROFUN_11467 [Planoprotostelium fungivorum]